MATAQIRYDWLRSHLKASGKSQRDLAAALGLDPSAVCRMLAGQRTFDLAFLPAIARLLEMTPTELVSYLLPVDLGAAHFGGGSSASAA